jgi:hypothetical protein
MTIKSFRNRVQRRDRKTAKVRGGMRASSRKQFEDMENGRRARIKAEQ